MNQAGSHGQVAFARSFAEVYCVTLAGRRSRFEAMGIPTRMSAEDARRLLGECFLFRELGPEARNALFGRVHVRSYAVGDTIFLMGSAGDCMMAVLSVRVRI